MYPKIWKIQLNRINELYKNNSNKIKPVRLRIRLTNRCNLSCRFCIRNTFTKEKLDSTKEISRKDLLRLIDDFAKLGGKFVEITGDGEPCVRLGTLLSVMTRIKKRKLFGELTTNGTLFTEDSIKKIVKINWDILRFSIDGKQKTHDFLRGQTGSYNQAVMGMLLFRDIKNKYNRKNPNLRINFILTNKNFNEIKDIIRLLKKTGGNHLWITPMILQIDSAKNLLLNKKEKNHFVEKLDNLIKISKEYNINTNLNDFYHIYSDVIPKNQNINELDNEVDNSNQKNKKKKEILYHKIKCFMPWSDIIVAEDGRVGPCLAFYFDKLNVKDIQLDKIWFGDEFENIRNSILQGNLGMFCKDCRQWWGPEEANLIKLQLEDQDLNKTFNNMINRRRYDETIKYLKNRLRDYSKPSTLYRNLGECYIKKKDYKSALSYFTKAAEIEPDLEWLNFSIGKTYFFMKDYANATKFLKENLSIKDQNPLSYHHSKLLLTKINKVNKRIK